MLFIFYMTSISYSIFEKYGAGGSDITAVAIAVQLGAECNIYGFSDGIYSSPLPDKSNAKKIDSISYEELMELTITGGGEPAVGAVELAKQYKVPLYIGKAFEEKQGGTYVMNQNLMVEKAPVIGISAASGCSIYSVREIENNGEIVVMNGLRQIVLTHACNQLVLAEIIVITKEMQAGAGVAA